MSARKSATPTATPAATPAATDKPTIGNGAVIKPAKVKPTITKMAADIAHAVWDSANAEFNTTAHCVELLQLPLADARTCLAVVFDVLTAQAAPDPLDTSKGHPTDAERKAYARQEAERKVKFWEAGNKARAIAQQAANQLPEGIRPIVSVKLVKGELSSVVTIIPAGTPVADVEKMLEHDKRALTQVKKRLEREAVARAEKAAADAGLPSPEQAKKDAEKRALADAENAGSIIMSKTGRPLSELSPLAIMVALLPWPVANMRELAESMAKQADLKERALKEQAESERRQAEAERKAAEKAKNEQLRKAAQHADGKGAGANGKPRANAGKAAQKLAKSATGVKPAPVGADANKPVAGKAASAKRTSGKGATLTDKGIKVTPSKADKGAPAGQVPAPSATPSA